MLLLSNETVLFYVVSVVYIRAGKADTVSINVWQHCFLAFLSIRALY